MPVLILPSLFKKEMKNISSLYLNVMEKIIPNIVNDIINILNKVVVFLLNIL